jgi:hypothetical protein
VGDPETLRLVHADLVNERDRLRDARKDVTVQLGPLPASAGVIIGLFAAFGREIERGWTALLFGLALVPFVLVMAISAYAVRRDPYRKAPGRPERESDSLAEEEWLRKVIEFERRTYQKLADDYERERWFLLLVQLLVGLEIVYLVLIAALEPYIT